MSSYCKNSVFEPVRFSTDLSDLSKITSNRLSLILTMLKIRVSKVQHWATGISWCPYQRDYCSTDCLSITTDERKRIATKFISELTPIVDRIKTELSKRTNATD